MLSVRISDPHKYTPLSSLGTTEATEIVIFSSNIATAAGVTDMLLVNMEALTNTLPATQYLVEALLHTSQC